MSKEIHVAEDIRSLLENSSKLMYSYSVASREHQERKDVLDALRSELQIARDAERTFRFRLSQSQNIVAQLQQVTSKLLDVKEENETLSAKARATEMQLLEVKEKTDMEVKKAKAENEKLRELHQQEIATIQRYTHDEILKIEKEMEIKRHEFRKQCKEQEKKLEEVQNDKHEAINLNILDYEEKLMKQNEAMQAAQTEIKQLREQCAANINLFQEKLLAQQNHFAAQLEAWKTNEWNRSTPALKCKPSIVESSSRYQRITMALKPSVNESSSRYQPFLTTPSQLEPTPMAVLKCNSPPPRPSMAAQKDCAQNRSNLTEALVTTNSISHPPAMTTSHIGGLQGNTSVAKPLKTAMFPVIKKRKLYTAPSDSDVNEFRSTEL